MRIKPWIALAVCLLMACPGFSQAPAPVSSSEIYMRLKKLNVLGTVLYVAAHPDDENSLLIAYMAKDRLYKTGYLSMTRGDGGQNLIGDEQGVELGLIRTQEMLAARRHDGAEQFFTRAFDFGFSKSSAEALKIWGKDKILSDVVWVIRRFQPDVIITRFPEQINMNGMHGHHLASAVLAREAFSAAADPARFPEQLKYGVKPWQAKRLLWNTFSFGSVNTTGNDQLKMDMGEYNPLIGEGYGEIAAESRSEHKSQGAALPRSRGESVQFFTLIAGAPATKDVMDDVNTGWSRVEGGSAIQPMVDALIRDFSLSEPERSVPALVQVYRAISKLPEGHWRTEKLKEVQSLIESCSGVWAEATVPAGYAVQGQSINVTITVNSRLHVPVSLQKITVDGFDTALQFDLAANRNYTFRHNLFVSPGQPISQPYWLAEDMSTGSFNVSNQQLIGLAEDGPAYQAVLHMTIAGLPLDITRPVREKVLDAVQGDKYEPLTILPPLTGRVDPELLVFPNGEAKQFQADIKLNDPSIGNPSIALTNAASLGIKEVSRFGPEYTFSAKPATAGSQVADLVWNRQGRTDSIKRVVTISYPHIPRIDYFRPAYTKMVSAPIKISASRIGYIPGAGDKVPEALRQLGYDLTILKENEITPGVLKNFDVVITGVRAREVHPWINDKYETLMDFVKQGGNLIVQYEKGGPFNTAPSKLGPYPFAVSSNRVTDEHAAVQFLLPDHPVLNQPNKITQADFDGWVQERGIYFADRLDPAYQAIFSMHDEGEPEQKGSLIIADYGKGKFVYTGLVFFRELPAGVPGAYRLMANIIALNAKRPF